MTLLRAIWRGLCWLFEPAPPVEFDDEKDAWWHSIK